MVSEGKCMGHDTAIFTMLKLILLTLWFHKIFKLIFSNAFFGREREGWWKVRIPQIALSFFKGLKKFLIL